VSQDSFDRQCLSHGELLEPTEDGEGLFCKAGGHCVSIWAVVRLSDRRVAFLADRYKGAAGTAEVGRWLLRAVLELGSIQARRGELHVNPAGELVAKSGHRLGKLASRTARPRRSNFGYARDAQGRWVPKGEPTDD
jgi:hypothetical protein